MKGGPMSGQRQEAIGEGRAMVKVRDARTGLRSTAAVCPGCWDGPVRRRALVARLGRRGLEADHPADGADRACRGRAEHAPGCPYGRPEKERRA
ncbi:MAG: hypothetical protein NTU62_19495 [Spirochaetes bacterium]|nr:hypothetical protein [Spirochaetota bacterium]